MAMTASKMRLQVRMLAFMATLEADEAQAQFIQLVETAATEGPHFVMRNGRVIAVIVDFKEWERMNGRYQILQDE